MNINPKDFENIQALHRAIQEEIAVSGAHDPAEYDRSAVSLYLSWYGLTAEQIKMFRKSDVLNDGIIIDGKMAQVPSDILDVFIRLRDSEGYYTAGDRVIYRRYEDSDYLIR